MMATIAITGMLLTATLSVLARTARLHRIADGGSETFESDARSILEGDIAHTKRFRKTAKGFALQMMAAIDVKTLELRHLPAVVTYEVREIGTRPWLVREQQSEHCGRMVELLCADVKRLDLSPAAPDTWELSPGSMSVKIEFNGEERDAQSIAVNVE